MYDYHIKRGKNPDGEFYVTVYMKRPDAIKDIVAGIVNFFDLYETKKELAAQKAKKYDYEKLE